MIAITRTARSTAQSGVDDGNHLTGEEVTRLFNFRMVVSLKPDAKETGPSTSDTTRRLHLQGRVAGSVKGILLCRIDLHV